jgi:hypothetical protein
MNRKDNNNLEEEKFNIYIMMLNLWKQDGRNNNRWSKKLYKLYCKLLFKDNRNFKKLGIFLWRMEEFIR